MEQWVMFMVVGYVGYLWGRDSRQEEIDALESAAKPQRHWSETDYDLTWRTTKS